MTGDILRMIIDGWYFMGTKNIICDWLKNTCVMWHVIDDMWWVTFVEWHVLDDKELHVTYYIKMLFSLQKLRMHLKFTDCIFKILLLCISHCLYPKRPGYICLVMTGYMWLMICIKQSDNMWWVICGRSHMTGDMWHATCDRQHLTGHIWGMTWDAWQQATCVGFHVLGGM